MSGRRAKRDDAAATPIDARDSGSAEAAVPLPPIGGDASGLAADDPKATAAEVEPEPTEVEHPEPAPAPTPDDPADASSTCPLCEGSGQLSVAPRPSPAWTRCDDCDGWGTVTTGSRIPDAALIDCERCAGRGYTAKTPDYAPASEVGADVPGAVFDNITGRYVLPDAAAAARLGDTAAPGF